ncbi:MAG: hypothetical protein E6Q97_25225 [Desulfurellales bacterium]|nr:MAG: hypothetical protein E6Q97_25225 [Desulfurellales bacterium]
MPTSKQDAINELLSIQKKGEEISEDEKKRLEELQAYLQNKIGKVGLGGSGKDQMKELEY